MLEEVRSRYHRAELLQSDPLKYAYRYSDPLDREIVAVISALFSFGNVKAIFQSLDRVFEFLGDCPSERLMESSFPQQVKSLNLKYRFYTAKDVQHLLKALSEILKEDGSLGSFYQRVSQGISDPLERLQKFRLGISEKFPQTPGLKFALPDPEQGAAKRLHMMLRWLVRKDEVDLGLWKFIPTSELHIPIDTHVFEISKALGLTRLKTPSRTAMLQITAAYRQICPEDPARYDFALCRLGILGLKRDFIRSLRH